MRPLAAAGACPSVPGLAVRWSQAGPRSLGKHQAPGNAGPVLRELREQSRISTLRALRIRAPDMKCGTGLGVSSIRLEL